MSFFDFFKKKIKGNISEHGEKIYYIPDHRLYKSVKAEITFKTVEDAIKAGYRAPRR